MKFTVWYRSPVVTKDSPFAIHAGSQLEAEREARKAVAVAQGCEVYNVVIIRVENTDDIPVHSHHLHI
jgi:hypothetical protein